MQFKSFLALASIVTLAFGADVADILNDLNNVKIVFTTLDDTIKGFSNSGGTSVDQATAISSDLVATKNALDQTTADAQASPDIYPHTVTPIPFSESDGLAVLETVNVIRPIIEDALAQLVAAKPAFAALPVNSLVPLIGQELTDASDSTTVLVGFLLAATPADLQVPGNAAADEIGAAFAAAVAAYSTS